MMRALLEQSTRRLVYRRRLPAACGGAPFYVSPSGGLRYLFRRRQNFDPTLCALVAEFVRAGDVVWDVGANVGLFAFCAAHLAGPRGRVIALEPDAWLVQLLRRSCALQPRTSAPVQVVPAAAGEAVELRTFNVASRSRSASFLEGYGTTEVGAIAEAQTVLAISLDWLAQRLPPPDVVKIDVEGAELEVLKGALQLLERARPMLICETASERASEVTGLLSRFGYRLFDGDVRSAARRELDLAPYCTVALPA